jgi:adenylate kinase family enzyme
MGKIFSLPSRKHIVVTNCNSHTESEKKGDHADTKTKRTSASVNSGKNASANADPFMDDEYQVSLIMAAIRKASEANDSSGWLLVDFPRTRNQAQLLEKELTGYVLHQIFLISE